MFDSDLDRGGPRNVRRRAFLATAAAAIGGLALWQWRRPTVLEAVAAAAGEPREVTVVLFSDAGERLKQVRIAKVIKSAAEWRKQLPEGFFDITRNADTEIAFSGKYWNQHDQRDLPLHLLRQRAVRFGDEVRIRHRLAQFLGADHLRECHGDTRHYPWCGTCCGFLHGVRRASRSRIRRWSRAHRIGATA